MTSATNSISDVSSRQVAIATGSALLLMCFQAPIAYFSVIQNLIVPGNAQATVANILGSLGSAPSGVSVKRSITCTSLGNQDRNFLILIEN